MRGLRSISIALLLAATFGAALAIDSATAARYPLCQGVRATIVSPADGSATNGTAGDDVIAGTSGNDIIYGNGGNDIICGRGGDDVIYAYAPDAPVSLTECVDSADLDVPYSISINGDGGDDVICGPSSSAGGYWEGRGLSGNDVVGYALGVDERIWGGSGNDTMLGSLKYPGNVNSFSEVYGGSGSDDVSAGEMFFFVPEPQTPYDVLADGGSGADQVNGAAVDDLTGLLKGGSGFDTCTMAIGTATVELDFHPSCEVQVV